MLNVLDLFSGIGGFSLGLERSGGFRTVAFCEIEPYCRRVLAKHWPDVRCYDDVRTLSASALHRDGLAVDVICGGFPCQDISFAGRGAGIDGQRSGLWGEFARLIGELGPRYVIVENVAALLARGLDRVLSDLAALGYDAEWHCIPASAVGAPHRRDRLWIVAYPNGGIAAERDGAMEGGDCVVEAVAGVPASDGHCRVSGADVADADQPRLEGWLGAGLRQRAGERAFGANGASKVGYADNERCEPAADTRNGIPSATASQGPACLTGAGEPTTGWWGAEPELGRVAHGVSKRVDRLKGLGNAVVPQIPELIGRAILEREKS